MRKVRISDDYIGAGQYKGRIGVVIYDNDPNQAEGVMRVRMEDGHILNPWHYDSLKHGPECELVKEEVLTKYEIY